MKLRPYQQECCNAIIEEIKQGKKSILFVLPTGTGKTIVFCSLLDRLSGSGRSIVMAHRKELLDQAVDKLSRVAGHIYADVEQADRRADMNLFDQDRSGVLVTSVQTQIAGRNGYRRMKRFRPIDFATLIIDEAHHCAARSYRHVIDYYRQNEELCVIGCTATPDRTDRKALGQIFESCAYEYGILEAIQDGWLVDIDQRFVEVEGLDFSECRTTAGDLNGADLAAVMEYERVMHEVATATLDVAADHKTLVFATSVKQAERMAEIFNRHVQGCADCVFGHTKQDDRDRILTAYRNNDFQILVNVGVATEGFDIPDIQAVVMARPTKSRSLYTQMIGRGTRPVAIVDMYHDADARRSAIVESAKPSVLVLDFVGNSGRHKLVSSLDVLGGRYDDEIIDLAVRTVKLDGKPANVLTALEQAEREREKQRREAEAQKRRNITARAQHVRSEKVNPFSVLQVFAHRSYTGIDDPITPKQRAYLEKVRVDLPDDCTKRQASALIGKTIERQKKGLATYRQLVWLDKMGVPDCENMTFEQASKTLDELFSRRRR